MEAKTVMVLGAPRGGTSMVVGLLEILGVDMGDVRKRDSLNPTGYFEDKEFMALCGRILRSADSNYDGFHPPTEGAINRQGHEYAAQIRSLIDRKASASAGRPWGWKHPAMSLLLELFLPHVRSPHLVVVLRNPLAVARSTLRYVNHDIKKRNYRPLTFHEALEANIRYQQGICDILARHTDLPHVLLSYEDVVKDPAAGVRQLAAFLEIPLTAKELEASERFVLSPEAMETRRSWSSTQWHLLQKIRRFALSTLRMARLR